MSEDPASTTIAPPADLSDTASLVAHALTRINHRLRAGSRELGIGTLSAFAMLDRRGPMRSGDLARLEGVAAPTMTRMMDALVQRGLVERSQDPDDGRACLLTLTDKGRDEIAAIRQERAQRLEGILAPLSAEQLRNVHDVVEAILRSSALE